MERELTDPSDDQIKHYLSGNLCRCTGYASQMRAIKLYLAAKNLHGKKLHGKKGASCE